MTFSYEPTTLPNALAEIRASRETIREQRREIKELRAELEALQSRYDDQFVELTRARAKLVKLQNQEPVGYANGDELDNMLDDRYAMLGQDKTGWYATPLYKAAGAKEKTE